MKNVDRTIANGWQRFEAVSTQRGVKPGELQELRMAFFAGAATVLGVMTEISKSEVSDAAGVHILEGMHQEVRAFAGELRETSARMRGQGL